MSLSKRQKDFLKTIKNPKDKKHQKQQFKLQNKFYKFGLVEEIIFIDGIFKTDNPELIAFFNECPMVEKIEENSLTKESLRDLTEPKTANENIPKEFCVEITEENRVVLQKLFSDFYKEKVGNLDIGRFLHSNPQVSYLVEACINFRNSKIVSTEEFLRYIGKEELIGKSVSEKTHKQNMLEKEINEYFNLMIDEVNNGNDYSPLLQLIEICCKKLLHLSNPVLAVGKINETTDAKPLDFDLPKKLDNIISIECLSIKDILESEILIKSSPLCQKLKDYLLNLVSKKTNPLKLQ